MPLISKKSIFSIQALRRFRSLFFQAFGFIALILGVVDIISPGMLAHSIIAIVGMCLASLVWAVIFLVPKKEMSRRLSVPDVKITVRVGDLLQQDANLVIGVSDTFDTEKGDIIKPSSLQGQFSARVYQDNISQLDQDIHNALQGVPATLDSHKTKGKNQRYPIGTVATLSVGTKKYFCSAYTHMGNNLSVESDIKRLSISLEKLWDEIRIKGHYDKVAMAVVGADLGKIVNASHADLIKLIILSFVLASREKLVAPELIIVLRPSNVEKVNMLELHDYLRSF